MQYKLSILIASRKNSKYLMKFLLGLLKTTSLKHVEVLVMTNAHDTWNKDAIEFFEQLGIRFFSEDMGLGRAGLHEYFNELYKHTNGEWVVYFCDDHYIIIDEWEEYVFNVIKRRGLDYNSPYCLVPRFDNVGTMNHILSRGFVEAMGGQLGKCGWIDSYINDILRYLPEERRILLQECTFHDFTHDVPSPMDEKHCYVPKNEKVRHLPKYGTSVVADLVSKDAREILKHIHG